MDFSRKRVRGRHFTLRERHMLKLWGWSQHHTLKEQTSPGWLVDAVQGRKARCKASRPWRSESTRALVMPTCVLKHGSAWLKCIWIPESIPKYSYLKVIFEQKMITLIVLIFQSYTFFFFQNICSKQRLGVHSAFKVHCFHILSLT